MACVYYLNGRSKPFMSEFELEDFLLEKGDLYLKYKDTVFSISQEQMRADQKIREHNEKTKELKKKMKDFRASGRAIFDELGNILNGEIAPYTGVNNFLGSVKTTSGNHMVPEFIADNLWMNLRERFERADYPKDIAEYLFGPGDDGSTHPLARGDNATLKDYRKRVENKWKQQAYTGTAIHEVLQLLFQKISADGAPYKIRLETGVTRSDIQSMMTGINADGSKNKDRLTLDQIEQIINIAKQLHTQLKNTLQGPLTFYTELPLTAPTNKWAKGCSDQLYGIADLVVVDKNGQTHIVDYKTSTHAFSEYSTAKGITIEHQVGLYQRMLSNIGLNMRSKKAFVLPIQMDGFKLDASNKFVFDTCKTEGLQDITSRLTKENVQSNLNEILPFRYSLSIPADQVVSKVKDQMAKWFTTYSDRRDVDDAWLRDKIKKAGGFDVNEQGNLEYKYGGSKGKTFVVKNSANAEVEMVGQVKKYIKDDQNLRKVKYDATIAALQEGIEHETTEVDFPKANYNHHGISATWFKDSFAKYCNKQWEIVDCEAAEEFGIIILKNKITNELDIKRISTQNLDYGLYNSQTFKDANGKQVTRKKNLCAGLGKEDTYYASQSDSLIAEATIGNIEIMETMLVLNALGNVGDVKITNIQVMNPSQQYGISLSNEELAYNWKALNDIESVDVDNFKNANIQLASKYQIAFNTFKSIVTQSQTDQTLYKFKGYTDAMNSFYDGIDNPQKQVSQLESLVKRLQQDFSADLESVSDSNLNKKHVQLYNQVIIALADKKGIHFRQQLRDHSQWLESTSILRDGVSGTYTDNPGNLSSDTLNVITKMVTQAYQQTRDDMKRKSAKLNKLVENLKHAKGFSRLQEHTFGNQTKSLYSNMITETPDGDILFVRPETLSMPEEREFLEYVLDDINHNRYSNFSDSEFEKMKKENDVRYYRVPLDIASNMTENSTKGLIETIKDVFRYLNPKYAWQKAREKAEGIFEAQKDVRQQQSNENFYSMVNRFDVSNEDTQTRFEAIQKIGGLSQIERNLETLTLKHDMAYIMKQNLDNVFPLIKAAMIHLTMSASMQNDPSGFKNDKKYLKEYVLNKIFGQSIITPEYQGIAKNLSTLRYAASLASLALSPVQFSYQMLQGLFTDIRLFITQPDGNQSFTFHNMLKAAKIVYADIFTPSGKPTMFSKINELYGMNDMDMNTYVDKIKSDRFGIHNFTNFLMKFSSRPDYYNRSLIFGSQMEADGCLDAHSIVDGELVYDFKKDKRFSLLINGNTSDPQYAHQRALYEAMAEQFEIEGAKDENGKPWVRKPGEYTAFPRAYTNKQSESMKSLADNIYGYYSHEKKSLIQSTLIGSMWMQFRTYWSGKKNIYLAPGGVTLQGHFKQITDPQSDQPLFYQVDEHNNVRRDAEPTTENTGFPVYKWVGDWREGVMCQLSQAAHAMYDTGSVKDGWSAMWNNPNKDIRERYRSNIKQITTDLVFWMLFGTIISGFMREWLREQMQDNKMGHDFIEGLGLSAASIGIYSVRNAAFDFNFIDSLGTPISSWSPFAFEWAGRQIKNISNICMGDQDFWDGVVNSFAVTKQTKPLFDAIKPDFFRNSREK